MIPRDPYIRASELIGFVEFVDQAGGDPLALIDEAKIPRSALTNVDQLISNNSVARLFEIAADRLNKPSFGLEWSRAIGQDRANHGPLLLIGKLATTFEEWIVLANKYWRLHCNAYTMRLTVNADSQSATVRVHGDPIINPSRQGVECLISNLCALGREVTGRADATPRIVRFQHSRPRDVSLHEQVFGCPVEFDCAHTELEFDPAILAFKTSGNLRLLKTIVGSYINFRIARMKVYDASMTTTVALAIPSIMGTGNCGVDLVAKSLEIHPKRLQRALADEGTTFSDILEDVRIKLAKQLLVDSDMPIERLAGMLDYSSSPPFTLAFKRWTGQTPLAFRKRERERLGRPSENRSGPYEN
jgi:AraC-like DNA-binding protein